MSTNLDLEYFEDYQEEDIEEIRASIEADDPGFLESNSDADLGVMKPRKHIKLYQNFIIFNEFAGIVQRHKNRFKAVKRGVSFLDGEYELQIIGWMTAQRNSIQKCMTMEASAISVWDWITSHKGFMNGNKASQLLAQLDDIGKFDTVPKVWRFCGYAVIDGKAERRVTGKTMAYNNRLRSFMFVIGNQFIKQQTLIYSDIYYAEKARQRKLHPEPEAIPGKKYKRYSDLHLHMRAIRKMNKAFLRDLWKEWRGAEGLPLGQSWEDKQQAA